jgi:hypothetical protein
MRELKSWWIPGEMTLIQRLPEMIGARLLDLRQGAQLSQERLADAAGLVGVVEEPVAVGVGQGRVRHVVVPPLRRELARDDDRAGAGAILEDFEDVAALGVLQGAEGPIVQHQHVDTGELAEEAAVGAVGPGEGTGVVEAGGPPVAHPIATTCDCEPVVPF